MLVRKTISLILLALILSSVTAPVAKAEDTGTQYNPAKGIVVQCTGDPLVEGSLDRECTFKDVLRQIKLLMNFAFVISLPITIIAIAWAGIQMLLAYDNPSKRSDAKALAVKVGWGFFFILAAWLIVYTIVTPLLNPQFKTFISQ